VEKYIKALLVLHKIYFRKIHDLVQLEELIAKSDPEIRSIHNLLATLNPYGIDVCYPGFETSVSEAKEAVKAMKAVRKFMRAKLGLNA
jgi:HEPN domain-containing protein